MLCDHGAELDVVSSDGMTPLMFAGQRGHDEICMYLSLRSEDVDAVDEKTGMNVFAIYLMKKDILRMKQLIMRGANINYVNRVTGLTPLAQAIKSKMNSKTVKFLLKSGANPHIEDMEGNDCCDYAEGIERYEKVKALTDFKCRDNVDLRIEYDSEKMNNLLKRDKKEHVRK